MNRDLMLRMIEAKKETLLVNNISAHASMLKYMLIIAGDILTMLTDTEEIFCFLASSLRPRIQGP